MYSKEIPDPPKSFLKLQREIWGKIWGGNSHLRAARDYLSVQILCEIFAEYELVKSELKKKSTPRVHENANGTIQTHPFVAQARDLRKELQESFSKLGLSPKDYTALDLPDFSSENKKKETIKPADRSALVGK